MWEQNLVLRFVSSSVFSVDEFGYYYETQFEGPFPGTKTKKGRRYGRYSYAYIILYRCRCIYRTTQ